MKVRYMYKNYIKKIIYILPILLLVVLFIAYTKRPNQNKITNTNQEDLKTETLNPNTSPNTVVETSEEKIIPGDSLCSQISKEFVTQVTGVTVVRLGTINDVYITACNYYLTSDNNSPYIAIILNKNLSVEVQKNFALKQKLTLITDPRIITDHYIVKSLKDDKIVNINLVLDPENFIRIDKNVDRAVDDEGLIKLAAGISKRL